MHYTYIIKSQNSDLLYIGSTSDLKRRLCDHNSKSVRTTSKYGPYKIVWYAAFASKSKAQEFEKYLKSSSGFAFRNKRLL